MSKEKCVPLAILPKQWFSLESGKVSLRARWNRVGGAATPDSSALPGCAAAPCPPGLLKNMAATRSCGSLKMPPSLLLTIQMRWLLKCLLPDWTPLMSPWEVRDTWPAWIEFLLTRFDVQDFLILSWILCLTVQEPYEWQRDIYVRKTAFMIAEMLIRTVRKMSSDCWEQNNPNGNYSLFHISFTLKTK